MADLGDLNFNSDKPEPEVEEVKKAPMNGIE
jgi:hypothetical protein